MKKSKSSVFNCCYIAYLFIYVARLNLSMAAPALKELTVLNATQIGPYQYLYSHKKKVILIQMEGLCQATM
jgi:sugar phosphate permease